MLRFVSRMGALRRFRRNESGVSALEFALIAPFMLLVFFGCIELSLLMQADRKVTATSSTLADLVARSAAINDTDMSDVFSASGFIIQPLNPALARMRVSSIEDDNGTPRVVWSDANNWSARAPGEEVVLPTGVLVAGGTVIFAEVEFDYTSEVGYFISATQTLEESFFVRPRRVEEIIRN